MTLTLQVSELKTESLRLESTGSEGTTLVELGPSGGLTGVYRQGSDRIELDHVVAALLTVGTVRAPVGVGHLEVPQASALRQLEIDGRLDLSPKVGFRGTASLGEAITQKLAFQWAGGRSTASLEVADVRYESKQDHAHSLQVGRLALIDVRIELGQSVVRVELLALERVAVELVGADVKLQCGTAQASGVHVDSSPLSLEIDSIRWPSGLSLHNDNLSFGQLDIGTARLSVTELPALGGGTSGETTFAPVPDLPFLDDLSGYFGADVSLDLDLPILRSRRATHRFRVPIEAGAINFKQLERGLSSLEDAVVDFEITKDSLILERDLVPGVTFDNQTLVSWPLQGADYDLAKHQKRVRLRKLLSYELNPALRPNPSRPAVSEGKSAVGLRQLDITEFELVVSLDKESELSLGRVGVLGLGNSNTPPLRSLRIAGELRYAPEREMPPSELAIALDSLELGASRVGLAGWSVQLGRISVERIDAGRVRFSGLRPAGLEATLGGLGLADLRIGRGILP
jgi:hypothetical protein